MRLPSVVLTLFIMMLSPAKTSHAEELLHIAGDWVLQLDPADEGLDESWFENRFSGQSLWLPGSLQAQGFGSPISTETDWTGSIVDRSWFTDDRYAPYREPGQVAVPFWLQPDRYYKGPAWYQRSVTVPATWNGQRITLELERPHWTTRVWINGREVGQGESLSVPHSFDLTDFVEPGASHLLTLRVDNRMHVEVGQNSHSVSDHTQSNWNGVVGDLVLKASPRVWLEQLIATPDLEAGELRVEVRIGNATGRAGRARLSLAAESFNTEEQDTIGPEDFEIAWDGEGGGQTLVLPLDEDRLLWDEFNPALYRLTAELQNEAHGISRRTTTFGLRTVGTEGTQITINGRRVFLRGTLDCAIFPLTGYPPTDKEHWKRIFQTCRDYGLNHVRFHSWCPPEAAFVAADELGIYLHVECGSWANQGASLGDGAPLDEWVYREAERILREYGNHPSFVMMAYGNEPAGPNQREYLAEWIEHFRAKDGRRLYTSAAGWPLIPESDFHVPPDPRIQAWGAELNSIINAEPPQTTKDFVDYVSRYPQTPVVSHEIGQWCAYPNFDEMSKYTGTLKPKNFGIFRDFLVNNHMGDQGRDFLMASGKLQTLAYKADIEMALRTRGFGGFQLLGLQDFSGQGTALVGVVDAFWEPKPYVDAETYSRFCSDTVPLALMQQRIFEAGQTLAATLKVAHYGPADLVDHVVLWRLLDRNGLVVREGALANVSMPTGELTTAGELNVPLSGLDAPQRLNLEVSIDGTDARNSWGIWVMDSQPEGDVSPNDDNLLIANSIDDDVRAHLESGGAAWLQIPPDRVDVQSKIGFSPVFWNTAWTGGQAPHTLGLLIDAGHAALADYPTDTHSDWQWWDPVAHSEAMVLDGLPPELRPIVQPIDTWFLARRLGLVFEARVGPGRLLVSSIDFSGDLSQRPSSRQLRASLLQYARSNAFAPKMELPLDSLQPLFRRPSRQERLGWTVEADSHHPSHPATHVLDDDPSTIWHTEWEPTPTPLPHWIRVDLGSVQSVTGLEVLPRQDMAHGRIARGTISLSADGNSWQTAEHVDWPNNAQLQTVVFQPPVRARFVELRASEEVDGGPWTSAAEINVLTAD